MVRVRSSARTVVHSSGYWSVTGSPGKITVTGVPAGNSAAAYLRADRAVPPRTNVVLMPTG